MAREILSAMSTTRLETAEIQGIVLRGYGKMPVARFLLLHIVDAAKARAWLATLDVDFGIVEDARRACNVAFTWEGLRVLGVDEATLRTFSPEFREGMVTPHRQRILGDEGASDPASWRWGGPANDPLHVFLALYAPDEVSLRDHVEGHVRRLKGGGLLLNERATGALDTLTLPGRKEHFGFRDGIAQPYMEGDASSPEGQAFVGAGEFVLGYPNQYGLRPDSPLARRPTGDAGLLTGAPDGEQGHDFGLNGTYLVVRQLSQDVQGFWAQAASCTRKSDGTPDPEAAVRLASKMVGRWPSGAPLVKFPDADPEKPGGTSDDDGFLYRDADAHGYGCPIGSHIRRTNPRDALHDDTPSRSLTLTSRRRMIRRGRAYGPPLATSMDPREMMSVPAGEGRNERGLLFLCFNASIANQFEFVQKNWANQPRFEEFYDDPDPLIGIQGQCPAGMSQNFTVQASPAHQRVRNLQRFVEVRGGAYLFMPGHRTLRYLTTLKEDLTMPASQEVPGSSFLSEYDAIPKPGMAPADIAKAQAQLLGLWLATRPGALFEELRRTRPILVPPAGPVVVTRFAHVVEALDLFDTYSTGPAAEAIAVLGGGAKFLLGIDDDPQRERDQSILQLAIKRSDADRIRRLVADAARALVERGQGRLDLVKDYGAAVPLRLAGTYFGIPGPDADSLRVWLRAMFRAVFRNPTRDAAVNKDGADKATAYRAYVAGLVRDAHRAASGGGAGPGAAGADTVLDRLVAMQADPASSFTDEEITFHLSSLLMGMIDTTSSALNHAVDALLDRPAELEGARAAAQNGDDELLLRHLCEALRFNPPVPILARASVREHHLGKTSEGGGATIPAGRLVYLAIASAMMDDRVLQTPLEFRLDRPDFENLHFGWGLHRCFGRHVARVLLAEMTKALLVKPQLRRASGAAGHLTFEGPFLASFQVEYDAV